jgi:hypothetical protein
MVTAPVELIEVRVIDSTMGQVGSADGDEPSFPCQWCHGALGIGLARIAMGKRVAWNGAPRLLAEELLSTDVRNALAGVERGWPNHVDAMCCGTLGSIEFLCEAACRLGCDDLRDLAKSGYAAIRADHEARPGTIAEHMYNHILGDDLLIAVLTGHNPNVFYEVAVADAAARPLISLIDTGSEIPFDISARRVLQYDLKPRSLQTGAHVDALCRSIRELEAAGGNFKVPFRQNLKPLGAAESACHLVPRSRDVPRDDCLRLIASAQSFVNYHGLALFSCAKMGGFEETARAALGRGVEMRVLLMHPDNPVLAQMTRDFSAPARCSECFNRAT